MSFIRRMANLGRGLWKVQTSPQGASDPLRPNDDDLERELAQARRQRAHHNAPRSAVPAATTQPVTPAVGDDTPPPSSGDEAVIYDGDRPIRKTL